MHKTILGRKHAPTTSSQAFERKKEFLFIWFFFCFFPFAFCLV